MSRPLSRVLLAAAALLLAAGMSIGIATALGASSSPLPASGGKIICQFGWYENLDSLNPFIGYASVAFDIFYLNYDTLLNYDPDTLQPIPGIAESWGHSADGKTWTFHIRHGVTWQDGQPLTAKDVAFTMNYVIDNQMAAFTNYTNGIRHVEATDDYTAVFHLFKPKAAILQNWTPILPEHIWSKISPKDANTTFQNMPPMIGSGPFQVQEWKKSDYVRMVANKNYWNGAPKIDELVFRFYTNMDTLAEDMKTGQVAFGALAEAQYQTFTSLPGWTALKPHYDAFEELGFNCYTGGPSGGNPVLTDWHFRQALNWAVDRDKLAAVAYSGAAVPATGLLPSGYWKAPLDYHWDPPPDQKYTFDPAKAEAALDAAGYRDTNGDGIRDYQGQPIKLRLWAINDKNALVATGKLMTKWFRDIGLQIDFQVMTAGSATDHMYRTVGGKFSPDYDMFLWDWVGDYDPGFLLSVFTTQQINGWSDCAWSNPQYDALYAQQDSEIDSQKRRDIIWKMQELVYRQSPYIVYAYPLDLQAYDSGHWQGWVQTPTGTGTVDSYNTYLHLQPKANAPSRSRSRLGLYAAIIVVAAVVIGVVALRMRRKPMPDEE